MTKQNRRSKISEKSRHTLSKKISVPLGPKLTEFQSSRKMIREKAMKYRIPEGSDQTKKCGAVERLLSSKGAAKPAVQWSLIQICEARKIKLR